MIRISRLHLVLVIAAVCALVSAPLASARPLATSGVLERTVDGWIGAAMRWVGDVAGLRRSSSEPAIASPMATQKGNQSTTNTSCIDPQGKPKPWCA